MRDPFRYMSIVKHRLYFEYKQLFYTYMKFSFICFFLKKTPWTQMGCRINFHPPYASFAVYV